MRVHDDVRVKVEPEDALTLRDRAALHRWERHVATIVTYEARKPAQ